MNILSKINPFRRFKGVYEDIRLAMRLDKFFTYKREFFYLIDETAVINWVDYIWKVKLLDAFVNHKDGTLVIKLYNQRKQQVEVVAVRKDGDTKLIHNDTILKVSLDGRHAYITKDKYQIKKIVTIITRQHRESISPRRYKDIFRILKKIMNSVYIEQYDAPYPLFL